MRPLKICLSPSDQLGKCCRTNSCRPCAQDVRERRNRIDPQRVTVLRRSAAYLSVTDVSGAGRPVEVRARGRGYSDSRDRRAFDSPETSRVPSMTSSEDFGPSRRPRCTQGGSTPSSFASSASSISRFAKVGLTLASINPSASPIWPPTGLALAARAAARLPGLAGDPGRGLRRQRHHRRVARDLARHRRGQHGRRPARRLADQSLVGRHRRPSQSPAGVARFALLSFLPTALCATIGVTSLALGGFADPATLGSIWLTWWLGDLAGALLVTPVIVLWAAADIRTLDRRKTVRIDRHLLRRLRDRPDRLQPDLRADRTPRAARLPGGAAAALVGAAPRPARHRDVAR